MGSIWFFGFIAIILYRAFYAGMNSKSLFYREPRRYEDSVGPQFDDNKVFGYALLTGGMALSWPLSLPLYGLYKLGERFKKEA
jgi:hypothetical protein